MVAAMPALSRVRPLVRCRAPQPADASSGEAKWPAMHKLVARRAAIWTMHMPNTDTTAYVVAVDSRRVGVAVSSGGRYRFVAADPDFGPLDGSSFLHLAQLEQAAARLARTVRGPRLAPSGRSAYAW